MKKLLLVIVVTGWLAARAGADVRQPKVFGDHRLLQRKKPVNTLVLERPGETQPTWNACRQSRSVRINGEVRPRKCKTTEEKYSCINK